MKRIRLYVIVVCIFGLGIVAVLAHEDDHVTTGHKPDSSVRSTAGENPWNQGQPPENWWG